jgi:hypothetical protein
LRYCCYLCLYKSKEWKRHGAKAEPPEGVPAPDVAVVAPEASPRCPTCEESGRVVESSLYEKGGKMVATLYCCACHKTWEEEPPS